MEDQAEVLVARGDPVRPLIIEEPPLLFDARDPIPPSPPHFAKNAIPSLAISRQSWWCRCCLVRAVPLGWKTLKGRIVGNGAAPKSATFAFTKPNLPVYLSTKSDGFDLVSAVGAVGLNQEGLFDLGTGIIDHQA